MWAEATTVVNGARRRRNKQACETHLAKPPVSWGFFVTTAMDFPEHFAGLVGLRDRILDSLPGSFQDQWHSLVKPPLEPKVLTWLDRQLVLDHPTPESALARFESLQRLQLIRAEAGTLATPYFSSSPFRFTCIPALLRYISQQMDYFAWHGLPPNALEARSRAFEDSLFRLCGLAPQERIESNAIEAGFPLASSRALLRACWARHFGLSVELEQLTPEKLEAALTFQLPVCFLGNDGRDIPGDNTLHASLILGRASFDAPLLRHFDPLSRGERLVSPAEIIAELGPSAYILMPSQPCHPHA